MDPGLSNPWIPPYLRLYKCSRKELGIVGICCDANGVSIIDVRRNFMKIFMEKEFEFPFFFFIMEI